MSNYNRITFKERVRIEAGLYAGRSFSQIAKELGRNTSSIAREVKKNRIMVRARKFLKVDCIYIAECRKTGLCDEGCTMVCKICRDEDCTKYCTRRKSFTCDRTNKAPFVCDGCTEKKKKNCGFNKFFYFAEKAEAKSKEVYSLWGGFMDLGPGVKNDEHGMKYAKERVESIKAYRDVTLDDLRKDYYDAPWAWPTAMRFQGVDNMSSYMLDSGIYLCYYENKVYFFNVGKEEPDPEDLMKMLQKGDWSVYTYSD